MTSVTARLSTCLSVLPGGRLGSADPALSLSTALPLLARRAESCWGVAALLFRQTETAVDLHVVAPAPMTSAVRLLTRRWIVQIRRLSSAPRWKVRVSPAPPPDREAYRCLFLRRR